MKKILFYYILLQSNLASAVGFLVGYPGDPVARVDSRTGRLEYNSYIYKIVDIVQTLPNGQTVNKCTGLWLGNDQVLTSRNCTDHHSETSFSVNFYRTNQVPIKFFGADAYNGLLVNYDDIINGNSNAADSQIAQNIQVRLIGKLGHGFRILMLAQPPDFMQTSIYRSHRLDFSDLVQSSVNFKSIIEDMTKNNNDDANNGNGEALSVLNKQFIDTSTHLYSLNFYGYGCGEISGNFPDYNCQNSAALDKENAFYLLTNNNRYGLMDTQPDFSDRKITYSRMMKSNGALLASFISRHAVPDAGDVGAPVFIRNNLTRDEVFIGVIYDKGKLHSLINGEWYITFNVLLVDNLM